MAETTNIEWATKTWSGWLGCRKVSPGCINCYITETPALRFRGLKHGEPRQRTSESYWKLPHRWNNEDPYTSTYRSRIFPSLCDPFDDEVPIEWFADFMKLIRETPNLDYLLLTKRPENVMVRLRLAAELVDAELLTGYGQTHDTTPTARADRISGGPERGTGDRQRREDLAPEEANGGQMDRGSADNSMQESSSGVGNRRGLSPSAPNARREKSGGSSSPLGVDALHGTDPAGHDGQSQVRIGSQVRQQAGQSGAGHIQRAKDSRDQSSRSEALGLQGTESSKDQTERSGRADHAKNAARRNHGEGHCTTVRFEAQSCKCSHHRQDVEALASWLKAWLNGEPPLNVWMGTSVENQEWADKRIPVLINIPAKIRFLSLEPLIGPVNLSQFFCGGVLPMWVIVGGESGPGSRPCDIGWIRSVIHQCRRQIKFWPVFVKQLGARPYEMAQSGPRGEDVSAVWLQLRHKKGGDMSEWPSDLCVREFP